jgi:hypothetical protein
MDVETKSGESRRGTVPGDSRIRSESECKKLGTYRVMGKLCESSDDSRIQVSFFHDCIVF